MLAELAGGLELGGGLGGDAGLVIVDLVEGVLDLAAKGFGGFQLGERGGQLAVLRVERRGVGGGLRRLFEGGERLAGLGQLGPGGFTAAGEFRGAGLGGAGDFIVVGGQLGQALALGAQLGEVTGEIVDADGERIALGPQVGGAGILTRGSRGAGTGRAGADGSLDVRSRGGAHRGRRRGTDAESGLALGQALLREFEGGLVEGSNDTVEIAAAGAVFTGEGEPDEGLDGIGGDAAALRVSEAEVVLGDAVALDGLGAEPGDLAAFLGDGGEAERGHKQYGGKRTENFHAAGWCGGGYICRGATPAASPPETVL